MRPDRPTRRQRTWVRIAVACAIAAAIVGGAAAARAWRRARQEAVSREIGLEAAGRGEWDAAIRNLGVLVARKVAGPEEALAFADARLHVPLDDAAHVAQAIASIDLAQSGGADQGRCDRLRLEAYVEGGMAAEAQQEAERVLARDERDAKARRVLVHACIARGRFEEAERALRRAVELEPGALANRIALAEILARRVREASLDRILDPARARSVVAEVQAWSRDPDAPAGIDALAHAVALDLGVASREVLASQVVGPERAARSSEEAQLRAGILDAVGRRQDAGLLLAGFRATLPVGSEPRRELALVEFRRALFSGDGADARDVLAQEFAREVEMDPEIDPEGLDLVLEAATLVMEGRVREARAVGEGARSTSREVGAWFAALGAAWSGEPSGDRGGARAIDVVAEATLRLVAARRLLGSGMHGEALRHADDAVRLARGRFDAAEAVAIEALARCGRSEEALARATRFVETTGGSAPALVLRLRCESLLLARHPGDDALARYRRSREAIIRDARAILDAEDAEPCDRVVAAAILGANGGREEAMAVFTRSLETATVADDEAVALAEAAAMLARAFDDMTVLGPVRACIARASDPPSDDARWALAWIDALESEHRGEVARGYAVLRAAAGDRRDRLAIAGRFGDARGLAGASSVLRASLPEGASIVVGSNAARKDARLAVEGAEALRQSGDRRGAALARLRLATLHPGHFDANEVLAFAAEARRLAPHDVELLAAIAGFLLAASPPDPAQALVLLGDALRLAGEHPLLREHAARAALLAGDPQLAKEHAEALESGSPEHGLLRASIAIAEGDGGTAEAALAVAGAETSGQGASLQTCALLLGGDVEHIDLAALDRSIVRIARMVPRAHHRALVVRCASEARDPVLVSLLAAEFLHRAHDGEIESIARAAAVHALERGGEDAALAGFRAAVACGDDALAARARSMLAIDEGTRAAAALRREKALALLSRDPATARDIADELLRSDPEDGEAALIAVAGAIACGAVTPAEADRLERLPRSPEVALLVARLALHRGRPHEARRAAREGLELASRRAYVAFETRAALQAIAEADPSASPATPSVTPGAGIEPAAESS